MLSQDGLRFDLRVVPPEAYGNLLQHFTGSKDHNVALRERAQKDGFSVSEYGIRDVESGEVFTTRDEDELYERLGYAYIPPELRKNSGELEAARTRRAAGARRAADLRGDLHSHTTWSDGKATLDEMVDAARARGYEYLAVCDHSQRLRGDLLAKQHEAIAALQEHVEPLRILRGIEVNIRADGSLDVDDETLAGLDWVMASVHSSFDNDPTERVLAAMENPNVDAIGHVTNRRINVRPPADVDRAGGREGGRDRHVPRDQLAAGPARHARRARAARRRGGRQGRRLERRPLRRRARVRRARDRAGAARVAGEGADPEHAAVGGDRAAAQGVSELRGAGRWDEARRLLAEARELASRVGATPFLDRIDAALAALG